MERVERGPGENVCKYDLEDLYCIQAEDLFLMD